MNSNRLSPSLRQILSFWALAGFSILFILPSARLWFQQPLQLIEFEFEYFLGLFANLAIESQLPVIAADKLIHFFGFLLIGVLYAICVEQVRRDPHLYSWRFLIGFAAILCGAFTLAMPWVSPDVFFYIGMGWLDGHYGLSPYLHKMSEIPRFYAEEMFQNVYPGFLHGPTSYGPLFQWLAKWIAILSGGNELIALALHKVLYLIIHGIACLLMVRLVPDADTKWTFLFYACNPLILFSILACSHNDHLMTLFVLAAFMLRQARRPLLCGAALGTAFTIKYIPILLLPLFFLDLILNRGASAPWRQRLIQGLSLGGGFMLTVLAFYSLYPEGALQFIRIIGLDHWLLAGGSATSGEGGGIGVYRNSIYFLLQTVSYAEMKAFYLAAYAALLAWLVVRAQVNKPISLASASLACYLIYFLTLNQTNQEWYLTWIIPFIPLIGTAESRRFAYQISAVFMPVIIFTIKNPPAVALVANVIGYMIILCFSIILLLRSMAIQNPPVLGTNY
jgi:alpha-1,6-mannosyltransferase